MHIIRVKKFLRLPANRKSGQTRPRVSILLPSEYRVRTSTPPSEGNVRCLLLPILQVLAGIPTAPVAPQGLELIRDLENPVHIFPGRPLPGPLLSAPDQGFPQARI